MKYLSALNIITVLLHLTIDGCMHDFVCPQLVTKLYSQNIFHNFFFNEGFSNKQSSRAESWPLPGSSLPEQRPPPPLLALTRHAHHKFWLLE